MVNEQYFNPWEGVKVGSSEIVSYNDTCWWILNIFFCMNLLSLKFGTHIINVEVIS